MFIGHREMRKLTAQSNREVMPNIKGSDDGV
jgi:hypothetical protein